MQTKTLANMKGRSRYNGGGALLLLLVALALSFLAACSDDDGDTGNSAPSLDECDGLKESEVSELSGTWEGTALDYVTVKLEFKDNYGFEATAMSVNVSGTYSLSDNNKVITAKAKASGDETDSTLVFYVYKASFTEESKTMQLYVYSVTSGSIFSVVQGEYITFKKQQDT